MSYDNRRYDRKQFNKPMRGGDKTGAEESTAKEILPHEPIQAKPLEVVVFSNFEKAMKAFRALVQKERILSSFKEKQSYEKPSDKKRRKRNEAVQKALEAEYKSEAYDERPRKRKFKDNQEE